VVAKAKTGEQVRSAGRMLMVLKSFTSDHPERSVSEITAELGLAPSTVRRLLVELEAHGFVRRDPITNRFRLGYQVLQIATVALDSIDLFRSASPVLDWLAAETGEGVQLAIFDERSIVHIDGRPSRHTFKVYHRRGQRHHGRPGSAVGKILYATFSEEELAEALADATWEPPASRDFDGLEDYIEHLDQVRRQGYAVNDGETDPDVWAVAAPVRDHTGTWIGLLNVPCLRSRVSADRESQLIEATVKAAQDLSASLGYRPV